MVEAVADDDVIYTLIYKDPKTGEFKTVKLAAGDLKDMDAILNRLEAKGLAPETLDVIRKELVSMATEVSDRPDNNVHQNDTTSESSDA